MVVTLPFWSVSSRLWLLLTVVTFVTELNFYLPFPAILILIIFYIIIYPYCVTKLVRTDEFIPPINFYGSLSSMHITHFAGMNVSFVCSPLSTVGIVLRDMIGLKTTMRMNSPSFRCGRT